MTEMRDLAHVIERNVHGIVAEGDADTPRGALDQVYAALLLRRQAEELLSAAARQARACGCTWQDIGDVVGVTRQAAFQRFGKPIDPRTGTTMIKTTIAQADVMALDLMDRIRQCEWVTVVSRFDDPMTAALDETGLSDAWASVIALRGEVESVGTPSVRPRGLHTVVDVPIGQEAGEMTMRVSYDTDGRIAGLYFLDDDAARTEP